MATLATPASHFSTHRSSRALRSAEGLIAGYVHTLATTWAAEPADPAAASPGGAQSWRRTDSAGPRRTPTTCWTRSGRVAGSFRSPQACSAR